MTNENNTPQSQYETLRDAVRAFAQGEVADRPNKDENPYPLDTFIEKTAELFRAFPVRLIIPQIEKGVTSFDFIGTIKGASDAVIVTVKIDPKESGWRHSGGETSKSNEIIALIEDLEKERGQTMDELFELAYNKALSILPIIDILVALRGMAPDQEIEMEGDAPQATDPDQDQDQTASG